jgi:FkbM family methyltransferase
MKIYLNSDEINLPLLPGDVSEPIWSALIDGTYEAKEAYWVKKAVIRGDRILELGAGLGIIATVLAATEDVHICAFDAHPGMVELAQNVIRANNRNNVTLAQGLMTAGAPRDFQFYLREDFWMSSIFETQGPFQQAITLKSINVDEFIVAAGITLLVMDIEGGEEYLLQNAQLPGVERVFVELHDHLYGLSGIRRMTTAMARKGFAYDPRGSSGACVLFSRDSGKRQYEGQ